mgnify:CR=1 FL=1
MNKLSKLIQEMDKEDLLKIRKDLVLGNIERLIEKRLESFQEKYSEKFCPVCGGAITDESFKLEFGSTYLRRKAYFDGADCMQYFIDTNIKKKQIHH